MKLYHGTTRGNLESIRTEGLKASVPQDVDFDLFPERGGNFAGVSLATSRKIAAAYGDIILVVELPDDNFEMIEIAMFGEMLIKGNISPEHISKETYTVGEEREWIPNAEVTDLHIIIKNEPEYTLVLKLERSFSQ